MTIRLILSLLIFIYQVILWYSVPNEQLELYIYHFIALTICGTGFLVIHPNSSSYNSSNSIERNVEQITLIERLNYFRKPKE